MMEPIHIEFECAAMDANTPISERLIKKVGVWIHSTNIFFETDPGTGFSIDKSMAKAMLEKIVGSDYNYEISVRETLLNVLKGVQVCDATMLKEGMEAGKK